MILSQVLHQRQVHVRLAGNQKIVIVCAEKSVAMLFQRQQENKGGVVIAQTGFLYLTSHKAADSSRFLKTLSF